MAVSKVAHSAVFFGADRGTVRRQQLYSLVAYRFVGFPRELETATTLSRVIEHIGS